MRTATSPAKTKPTEKAPARREAILARGLAVLKTESDAILGAAARQGDAFVGAVEAILNMRGRVCVTGMGKAGLIGNKIQATLASTGTLAYTLHPVDALHGDLGMTHGDDVVLALSKSGSSELVELLPRLKETGCKIILLTAKGDSAAAKHADFVIDIGQTPEACPLGLAPSSSTAAMLALGDAIALTVMEQKSIQPDQYASYHPGGALGRFLMKAGEVMRRGADCPTVMETESLARCYEAILAAPKRAGAAAITDPSGRLTGIVTHGDFFRLFNKAQSFADRSVSEVMTKSPKRVAAEARVTDALQIMKKHSIDELPVVDASDKLVGMIDIQDLLSRGFTYLDNT